MKTLSLQRLERLIAKFRTMNRDMELLVGVANRWSIYYAADRAGKLVSVETTHTTGTRDDGTKVPIYLVRFQ